MALYLGNTMVSMMSGVSTGGIDTSDATATASDIASGKTAYVNGQKITGNVTEHTGISFTAHSDSTIKPTLALNSDGTTVIRNTLTSTEDMLVRKGELSVALLAKNFGNALAKEVLSGKTFTSAAGAVVTGTCTYDADTSDATASAASILSGQTAYVNGNKITGTYVPSSGLDTSDATATASTILSGKTAYVKGAKVTGTCTYDATTTDATATASTILQGKTAYVKGTKLTGTCAYDANTSDATATASDIVKGKTAYVNGSKITGTHTESAGLDTSDATAAASDIAKGKTAYVNGKKVTGTLDVKTELLNYAYPVGSIYMSVRNTSPQSFLGGTWVEWGSGRVPVGVNTNDTNFNSVEKTGGASTVANALIQHTHTITASGTATSAGAHTHGLSMLFEKDAASGTAKNRVTPAPNGSQSTSDYTTKSAGAHTHSVTVTATAANAGSAATNSTHNNLQPYITCYMWKRTA